MLSIKAGSIFRKNYIDHVRNFLAIEDSVGLYCWCLDLDHGGAELIKIPHTGSATNIEVLC